MLGQRRRLSMLSLRLCYPFTRVLFARTWRVWLLLVVAIAVGALLSYHSPRWESISGVVVGFILICLLATLAMVDPQETGASGFPGYLQMLPMGDTELVLWPMIISVGLLFGLGIAISILIFGSNSPISETWWIAPYLGSIGSQFQAASWVPMKRPELRACLSIFTVASIVGGPLAFLFKVAGPALVSMIYLVLALCSMWLCVRGVSKVRHGEAKTGNSDKADYKIPELSRFKSGVSSQVWLEYKRNGLVSRVLNSMFLTIFGIIAAVSLFTQAETVQIRGVAIPLVPLSVAILALVVPPYLGFGGCCGSEKDNVSKDRSLSTFLAYRPLTEAQIVEAKLRMTFLLAIKLGLFNLGIALLFLALPVQLGDHRQTTLSALVSILSWRDYLILLGMYGLMLMSGMKNGASAIWCSLGRMQIWQVMVIGMLPMAVGTGIGMRLFLHPEEIKTALSYLPYAVWVIAGGKLLTLIPSIIVLRRKELVADSVIGKWLAFWSLFGLALFWAGRSLIPDGILNSWSLAAQIFCLLPFVRIALAPIFVYRGRHQ